MLGMLEARLRAGLTRACRNLAGAVCLTVAAIFLTRAAWLSLALSYNPQTAALVVGLVYLVLALLLFFIPVRRRVPVAAAPRATSMAAVIDAFLAGRNAGRAMRDD
ncbi:hypothetical protein ACFSDD_08490 [Salipiger marinus]|uniref:hypothetical protein n=1 Tax=Salipiger marinus TaxID=555512 RepID=UPI001E620CDF|nr:hypothetical protein [Salipiger manganoxidans]MCD1620001.1 hypothetical protein [Salipiger manganoxidans]MEB3420947.1 hypothetical protein [Salipiger manganoxidans]